MMIGLPGTGKTTYILNNFLNLENCVLENDVPWVISSDANIEIVANVFGLTYSEVWESAAKLAEFVMYKELSQAIRDEVDIIWDQTNITRKTRANKLSKIPKDYKKYAYVVIPPEKNEWERRLLSRSDKIIPSHVLSSMIDRFEYPTLEEGFDAIIPIGASNDNN